MRAGALLPIFLGLALFSFDAQASDQEGPYSVSLLINGVPQQVYQSGGQSFVAGSYGSAYEIRVQNNSGRRIEAVVAVDGRDVITGQPVQPRRQRGYIIAPYSATSIDGFRSSTASVATFRFATIPESYAWRTGTSWDIGTIRVFIYEEEAPPVVIYPPVVPYGGARSGLSRQAPGAMDGAAESAPQAMGTEYGEQRWSPVSYTTFQRSSRRPEVALGIRYNSYEMLASAGIIAPYSYPQPYPAPCYGYGCYQGGFAPPPPPIQTPRRIYFYR